MVRQARKAAGLSRKDFAERLGVTPNYIYMVETGRKAATHRLLELIGFKLKVEVTAEKRQQAIEQDELLAQLSGSADAKNFLSLWFELDDQARRQLWAYALSLRGREELMLLVRESSIQHWTLFSAALRRNVMREEQVAAFLEGRGIMPGRRTEEDEGALSRVLEAMLGRGSTPDEGVEQPKKDVQEEGARLVQAYETLSDEERMTLQRCLELLRGGQADFREHLSQQLRMLEELHKRRARRPVRQSGAPEGA